MAESGGPTTQSGIYYQNTITALYLGALLDIRPPTNGMARVISVRVEAPDDIDDTVVTYADGATLYIQAKEQFALKGEAWVKFWESARRQATKCRNDRDQFRLVLGTLGLALERLRDTLERAQGKNNLEEWRNALNQSQSKIAQSILSVLSMSDEGAFNVIKRTRAEFIILNSAETTGARDWMPYASEKPSALHSRLRDCCGGAARVRHTFRANDLSEELFRKFNIRIFGTHCDGLERYREAIVTQVDHIGVPGTSISVRQDDLFVWPTIVLLESAEQASFEDEDPWLFRRDTGHEVDLREFPSSEMKQVILESGAGHGKSTILRATVRRLAAQTSFIPALIHAQALPEHQTIQDYLNTEYNASYQVAIDWTALCEQGRAVVFIDGVDELNDSSRAALISMIGRAVARFPQTPILIGARDASVTSFPPQFKVFRVQRLDDEQMITMLKAYFRTRGEFDIEKYVRHVHAYEELDLLCRIPLFLAIFAATLPKDGMIPASRADVLELYILHALSPERHKGVGKPIISKSQLRQGAEVAASLSLARNEAAVPESTVRANLSKALGNPIGDDCVDALVQHGLLERRGHRLAFSIPTIQEYLAGCVLAEVGKLNAEDWLENVYRRPWAQAIQFAVEKIDNADAVLRRQIEREDDLFYTSLRLAARCIVNGASVSAGLKDEVTSKLVRAFKKSGYHTSLQIGSLISDGFCRPMHHDIRELLITSKHMHYQRPSILARLADHHLTLECLRSILKEEDIRELWDSSWHCAIKPVKNEAVELLLARARNESGGTLAASVIAESIFQLKDASLIDWQAISVDEALPLVVRAAATYCMPDFSEASQIRLIEAAFAEAQYGTLWQSFGKAYMSKNWWKTHFRQLLQSDQNESHVYFLNYLDGDDESEVTQDVIGLLADISQSPLTNPHYRIVIQCMLGANGLTNFADSVTEELASANFRGVLSWINNAVYFPAPIIARGTDIILARSFPSFEQTEILDAFHTLATYEPSRRSRNLRLRGPFRRLKQPREISKKIISRAEQLMRCGDGADLGNEKLLSICAKLGSEWARQQLRSMIDDYMDKNEAIKKSDWNWIASAVLDRSIELDSTVLWKILSKGKELPMYDVVRQIIDKDGPGSYQSLADFVNANPGSSAWSAVYFYFERNAARIGLNVRRANGKLEISKVI